MTGTFIIGPEADALLFSPLGIIFMVIGASFGIMILYNKFGPKRVPKPFIPESLEKTVRKKITKKAALSGMPKNKILMKDFTEIGYIIKSVKMPKTKLTFYTKEGHKKNTQKTVKKEMELPESFVYICTKRTILSKILGMFGLMTFPVIVSVEDLKDERDKIIELSPKLDFDFFGGAYISNKLGFEYIRYLGDIKVSEDVMEEYTNMIKKFSYYDRNQSTSIEKLEKVAQLGRDKWDSFKDEMIG